MTAGNDEQTLGLTWMLTPLKAKSQTREFPTGQQLNPIWPVGWSYQLSV